MVAIGGTTTGVATQLGLGALLGAPGDVRCVYACTRGGAARAEELRAMCPGALERTTLVIGGSPGPLTADDEVEVCRHRPQKVGGGRSVALRGSI